MINVNTVMISTYAKLPASITVEEIYKTMVVAVIVDLDNGTIVKAECSVVTDLCKEFIAKLMTGYNLNNGPDMLLQRFDETYYGHAKRAIETAIKMIFTKYEEIKSQRRLKKVLEEG